MPVIKKIIIQRQGTKYPFDLSATNGKVSAVETTLKKGKVEFVSAVPSVIQPNTLYVTPFTGKVF